MANVAHSCFGLKVTRVNNSLGYYEISQPQLDLEGHFLEHD